MWTLLCPDVQGWNNTLLHWDKPKCPDQGSE